jgi:hypothetical protein
MTTQNTLKTKLKEIANNLMFAKFELENVRTSNKSYKSLKVEEIFNKIEEIYNNVVNVEEVTILYLEMLIADLYRLINIIDAKIIRDSKEVHYTLLHMVCANISKVCKLRRIMYVEIDEQKYM